MPHAKEITKLLNRYQLPPAVDLETKKPDHGQYFEESPVISVGGRIAVLLFV
jgi:hypothetical protein